MVFRKRLKINTKILFMVSVIIALLMGVSLTYTIINDSRRLEMETAAYETEKNNEINATLQYYVEMACLSIQADHDNAHDPAFLKKQYGSRLENIVDMVHGGRIS